MKRVGQNVKKTQFLAQNNRTPLSDSSGGRKPKIQVSTRLFSLLRLQRRVCSQPLPFSGGCRRSWACGYMAPFSASISPWPSPLLPVFLSSLQLRHLALDLGSTCGPACPHRPCSWYVPEQVAASTILLSPLCAACSCQGTRALVLDLWVEGGRAGFQVALRCLATWP